MPDCWIGDGLGFLFLRLHLLYLRSPCNSLLRLKAVLHARKVVRWDIRGWCGDLDLEGWGLLLFSLSTFHLGPRHPIIQDWKSTLETPQLSSTPHHSIQSAPSGTTTALEAISLPVNSDIDPAIVFSYADNMARGFPHVC